MIQCNDNLFGKVVTAMVTPFDDNLKIDFTALEKLVEHLIKTGSQTFIVNGTTGESPTLEDQEREELLKAAIKFAKGRIKVLMGVSTNDTEKAVKASKTAEALGAEGLLVIAPYYNKPSQDGLMAHFSAVAKATKLPMILYNIPGRTGVNISVETTVTLAKECPTIKALKDSTGNIDQAQDVASLIDSPFWLYSGDDYLTLPLLSVGACGVVSVASNIVGNAVKQIIENFQSGNVDKAREMHLQYLPLFKGLFIAPNPTCVKYALSRLGLCKEHLRLPLVPLKEPQRKIIDQLLNDKVVKLASV